MSILNTAALITATLGDEADVDGISASLMAEKAGTPSYTEATFQSHLDAILDKGEAYTNFLDELAVKPGMKAMFGFIISQGPEGVYGLLETMGGMGLLDKNKVRNSAKISAAKTRVVRAWFRQLWDELAPEASDFLNARFEERRAEFETRFPEVKDCADFQDMLRICGKSTLNAGVGYIEVPQTGKKTSVALGWRVDAHSPKRNGGWDPKANDGEGELTELYYEDQKKAQAKIAAKDAGVQDDDSEDVADDNSAA
tara:strand:- start:7629 stop:8393 length:765 start_codon:yes stop_codon:yes gene_type:complete